MRLYIVLPIPNEGPNNVVRVQWRKAELQAWRSVGSPTSDRAVWGSSPDKPVWRGVISTRQRWPLVPTVCGPISKQSRHVFGGSGSSSVARFLNRISPAPTWLSCSLVKFRVQRLRGRNDEVHLSSDGRRAVFGASRSWPGGTRAVVLFVASAMFLSSEGYGKSNPVRPGGSSMSKPRGGIPGGVPPARFFFVRACSSQRQTGRGMARGRAVGRCAF